DRTRGRSPARTHTRGPKKGPAATSPSDLERDIDLHSTLGAGRHRVVSLAWSRRRRRPNPGGMPWWNAGFQPGRMRVILAAGAYVAPAAGCAPGRALPHLPWLSADGEGAE